MKIKEVLMLTSSTCFKCKAMYPTIDYLDADPTLPVRFKVLSLDDNPDLAFKYKVRGLPAFVALSDGTVKGTRSGSITQTNLRKWVEGVYE